ALTMLSEILDFARVHVQNGLSATRIGIADNDLRGFLRVDLFAAEVAHEDLLASHLSLLFLFRESIFSPPFVNIASGGAVGKHPKTGSHFGHSLAQTSAYLRRNSCSTLLVSRATLLLYPSCERLPV